VSFLPLGADVNSAVYRAVAQDGQAYFLKLKRGAFDEVGVALPRFLHEQGIRQVIAPRLTQAGRLWTDLHDFQMILYPYVQGRSGFEVELSPRQWADFGAALKRVHTSRLPDDLYTRIPRETYTARFREQVKTFLAQVKGDVLDELVAMKVTELLKAKESVIRDLIQRAEGYARRLQAQSNEYVLCHADVHAGNILVDAQGALYIVDWDNPILAPKERDLMFIGGAQGFRGVTPAEEETLFYQGFGPAQIDPLALAYYRYERIIQDIAAFCEQLLLTGEGGEDREQSFGYLASNFLPGNTIEMAYQTDKTARM
jgi:spectinomycin phosphotransferase